MKYSIPTIVSAVIGIVAIPVITRIYPPEEYGKISLFYSLGILFATFFSFDLCSSCIRFHSESKNEVSRKALFNFAFFVGTIVTVLVGIWVFAFFRESLAVYIFGEANGYALLIFFLYIELNIIYKLQVNYSRLAFDARNYNFQQTFYILTNKIFFAFAAIISTNYIYAILIIVVSMAIQELTIGRKCLKFQFEMPGKAVIKRMLCFSIPLLPVNMAVILNNSIAKMVLSFYGDFNTLGVISIATNLANTFNIISSAFCVYWGPFMYQNYDKEKKLIKQIHNYVILVSLAMVIGIFVFQDILFYILGQNYRQSQPYFLLIMLMPIQLLICETTSYGINLANKTYISMIISIISCVVNGGIVIYFYPKLGAVAVSLGIAVSALYQLIVKSAISQKFYASIDSYLKTFASIAVMVLICVSNLVLYHSLLYRILLALCCIGVGFVLFHKEIGELAAFVRQAFHKIAKERTK